MDGLLAAADSALADGRHLAGTLDRMLALAQVEHTGASAGSIDVGAVVDERLGHEVGDVVGQRTADQEFHREVVDALDIRAVVAPHRVHPALDQAIARGVGRRMKPIVRRRHGGILPHGVNEAVRERSAK